MKSYNTILLDSNTLKVYKNPTLNEANFGNYTHNDYKIACHIFAKIGGVDYKGKYLQNTELSREHILSAYDLSKEFKMNPSDCYKALKKSTDKLIKTDIKIKNTNNPKHFLRINLCSKAEYNESEGCISIKLTDDIMPYIKQIGERFVLYNLKDLYNFGSLYTTRLYELIQQYKDTGWFVKTVEDLRFIFAVGDNKYLSYYDFKRKTFKHACDEINRNFNINLKFEEIKLGRKVNKIKFSFKRLKRKKGINPINGDETFYFEKYQRKNTPKPKTKCVNKKNNKTPILLRTKIKSLLNKALHMIKL